MSPFLLFFSQLSQNNLFGNEIQFFMLRCTLESHKKCSSKITSTNAFHFFEFIFVADIFISLISHIYSLSK